MESAGVKDTIAYKIVRQIVDHIYGADEKLSSEEFISIFHDFRNHGGLWEKLINGDMDSIQILEETLDRFMENRKLSVIASRIVGR